MEAVYNLEVEGNNNYFAAGVLVHNCDDPHDARKVESAAERQKVLNWWDHAFYNRVNNFVTGRRVIVGQRTHHLDLMGHVLKTGEFVELRVPEEFEPSHACSTPIGWADPRTAPGEMLRPARFGPAQKAAAVKRLGSKGYAAQHLQRPQGEDGVHFKPAWFAQRYQLSAARDLIEFPGGRRVVLAHCVVFTVFDPSTGKSGGDCQGIATFAWTPGNELVVLEALSARHPIEAFPREIGRAVKAWGAEYVACEANGFQLYVARDLRAAGLVVRELSPEGKSKLVRAQKALVLAEGGRVWLPREGDWVQPYVDQLTTFTGEEGGQDELVDCTAYAALDAARYDDDGEGPLGVIGGRRARR